MKGGVGKGRRQKAGDKGERERINQYGIFMMILCEIPLFCKLIQKKFLIKKRNICLKPCINDTPHK